MINKSGLKPSYPGPTFNRYDLDNHPWANIEGVIVGRRCPSVSLPRPWEPVYPPAWKNPNPLLFPPYWGGHRAVPITR